MKETGIIMSGSQIPAILGGRMTQTRRVVEPQPYLRDTTNIHREPIKFWAWLKGNEYETWPEHMKRQDLVEHCPYGQAGDRLWVRETCKIGGTYGKKLEKVSVLYRADDCLKYEILHYQSGLLLASDKGWRPSIHMPKWACRLWLEITEARVEQINQISEEDAIAEGMSCEYVLNHVLPHYESGERYISANYYPEVFRQFWNSLNAKRGYGWDMNPWVWVLSFKRGEKGEEEEEEG